MAYYVYLLASKKHGTLYLGVTNDIVRRGYEHRTKVIGGFTARYGVNKLVWFEIYGDAVTPGRCEAEPGIHNYHRGYGFRARAKWRVPE